MYSEYHVSARDEDYYYSLFPELHGRIWQYWRQSDGPWEGRRVGWVYPKAGPEYGLPSRPPVTPA